MSRQEDDAHHLLGFSRDGKHPFTLSLRSNNNVIDPDGMLTLFHKEADITQEEILYASNLGNIRAAENPKNPADPYLFIERGYELEVNKTRQTYEYTLHPTFAVDFALFETIDEERRPNAYAKLNKITPKIKIKGKINPPSHSISSELQPEITMVVGCNDALLFTIDSKRSCPNPLTNVDTTYRTELDKYYVQGILSDTMEVPGPTEKRYFKPFVRAVLTEAHASVGFELGQYASHAEDSLPSKKDISSFASATVYLAEFDPQNLFGV